MSLRYPLAPSVQFTSPNDATCMQMQKLDCFNKTETWLTTQQKYKYPFCKINCSGQTSQRSSCLIKQPKCRFPQIPYSGIQWQIPINVPLLSSEHKQMISCILYMVYHAPLIYHSVDPPPSLSLRCHHPLQSLLNCIPWGLLVHLCVHTVTAHQLEHRGYSCIWENAETIYTRFGIKRGPCPGL